MSYPRTLRASSSFVSSSSVARLLSGLVVVLLMLFGTVATGQAQSSVRPPVAPAVEAPPGPEMQGGVLGNRSDGTVWHDIRKGAVGKVSIPAPDAATLIQSRGEDWRLAHNDLVKPWGGRLLLAVVAILALFFLVRGRIRIAGGRSGRVIPRFSLVERVVHWFTAVVFVLLAVSGLILFLGKDVLLPLVGPAVFAALASASLQGHNLFGPLFVLAVAALFVTFVRGNGYRWVDVKWVLKGGGMFGGHASSHRYNFGEKSWFWLATVCGVVLSASGTLLLFPDHLPGFLAGIAPATPPGRTLMQLANLLHGAAALAFVAVAIGHVYIGSIGMEGALEGMTRGTVDENWAKEHHDLWYEAHVAEASTDSVGAEVLAAAGKV